MNKKEFMEEVCYIVKANIQDSIDQFGGEELDEADMTYEEWIEETTENNGEPTEYCYGL